MNSEKRKNSDVDRLNLTDKIDPERGDNCVL